MSLLNDLISMFDGHHSQAKPANQPMPQGLPVRPYAQPPAVAGVSGIPTPNSLNSQPPEITYNPNPNTNIPYSSHSLADAQLGNQYVKNPQAPQFIGVDPARFGFPADNTATPKPPSFSTYNQGGIQSVGGTMGGYGGTLGIDHGQLFGSYNKNGKILGQFGPQG